MTDFINGLSSDDASLLLYKLGLEDLSEQLMGIFALSFINFLVLLGIVIYLIWKEDSAFKKKFKKEAPNE